MNIYLTLLATDLYLPYALTLHESYLAVNSKYPFVVGLGREVSSKTISILDSLNIPHISVAEKFDTSERYRRENKELLHKDNWNYVWEKINFLNMTQFDKICALDADMIMLHNIDDIFDKCQDDKFYSTSETFNETTIRLSNNTIQDFNCGFIVFKPRKELWLAFRENLKNNKEQFRNEATLFWDTINKLNILEYASKYNNFIDAWLNNRININLEDINIFHFLSLKPIEHKDKIFNTESKFFRQYYYPEITKEMHKKWWEFYSKVQVKLSKIEAD